MSPLRFLDGDLLHEIAGGFADAAGVVVVLCDLHGNPLISGAPKAELFEQIATHVLAPRDQTEASFDFPVPVASAGEIVHGSWGAGLPQVAAPIIGEPGVIGVLAAITPPDAPLTKGQRASLAAVLASDEDSVAKSAKAIPIWGRPDRERLDTLLQLLAQILGRLCRQEINLRNRMEDLTAVYSVADLVASASNVQEILDTAAEQVRKVMDVRASSIRLLDPQTDELIIRSVCNLSDRYLNKGPIKLSSNQIDQQALQGGIVFIPDMASDPRTLYPEDARREGIVSCLVAGMVFRGAPIGIIRAYTDHPHSFGPFDESLLKALAAQLASAIANARLLTEAIDTERYTRQLRYASEVQRRMIPTKAPESSRVDLACVYQPSLALGGDFCDFISLPAGNVGAAIADVVGKGVAAALMMSSVRAALRSHAHGIYDIDQIMRLVNRHMCRDTLTSEFATLCYGVFSGKEPVFTYCNAGHEPPYLIRSGALTELESSGLAIGIMPDEAYARHRLNVEPGDVLVFYTDGTFDATSFDGEYFGRARLRESALRHAGDSAEQSARNILMDIRRFIGLASQVDDITIMVARVK